MARRNKYNAKKTWMGNIQFDSKAESMYYLSVLEMKQKGIISEFELQPVFELQPAFTKNGKRHKAITYKADFKLIYPDGNVEIVDVKGQRTEVFNIKHKLFEKAYPDLELKIVKG